MKIIRYINNAKLVLINNKKYILKKKKIDTNQLFSTLKSRDFSNYIEPDDITEVYERYPFIDEVKVDTPTRAIDIVLISSLLHNKTTEFQNINIDDIKEIYENMVEKLDNIYTYYSTIQDEIEEHIYMSPAEQLLMNNISKIYFLLNYSRENIEQFYKESEKSSTIRKSIIHGNLSLDHIIEGENKYLISWNNAHIDIPVYDIVNFYRKDFDELEINSLFDLYQSKYKFNKMEKSLFFSMISVPEVVTFNSTNFINTINVRKLVDYNDKTINFILQQDEKNEKADK